MNREYQVSGAFRNNGKDVIFIIEAKDENDAEKKARERGILVNSVIAINACPQSHFIPKINFDSICFEMGRLCGQLTIKYKPFVSYKGGFLLLIACFVLFGIRNCTTNSSTPNQSYSNDFSSSQTYNSYTSPKKHNDYKSTKPTWQMDGQEQHELDQAWDKMSPEQKETQLRRDFGNID